MTRPGCSQTLRSLFLVVHASAATGSTLTGVDPHGEYYRSWDSRGAGPRRFSVELGAGWPDDRPTEIETTTRNDPPRPLSDESGDARNAGVDNRGASVRAGRLGENPPIRAGAEGATSSSSRRASLRGAVAL
jgi:hypothetical protein